MPLDTNVGRKNSDCSEKTRESEKWRRNKHPTLLAESPTLSHHVSQAQNIILYRHHKRLVTLEAVKTGLGVIVWIFSFNTTIYHQKMICPVGWGCRIHRLHFCRGVKPHPPTSVLDMTLNNLMVRFQWCWSFGECWGLLHYHFFQIQRGRTW